MRSTVLVPTAGALLLLAFAALGGCTLNTNVDATGAAPPSTSHLAVTVEQIWFATAADTLPEASSGWLQKTLPTPVTLELATLTPGTLISLATQLGVTSG